MHGEIFTYTSIRVVWIPGVLCIALAEIASSIGRVDASTLIVTVRWREAGVLDLVTCATPNCPIQDHPMVASQQRSAIQRPRPIIGASLGDILREGHSVAGVLLVAGDVP